MALKHFFQLICFLWLIEPLAATPTVAKPGCRDTCGNVTIAYPFGIGTGCFFDEWFKIVCHDDRPYLSKYYGQGIRVEVLDVSLVDPTITINSNNSKIRVCEEKSIRLADNLLGSPFFYDLNKVILLGCGSITLSENARILGACTPLCGTPSRYGCNGRRCCEITIPSTAQNFNLNFSHSMDATDPCASIIFGNDMGDLTSYSDPSEIVGASFLVVLRWSITEQMLPELESNPNCYHSRLLYGEYRCSCGYCVAGNP